jgi:uncharacterized protein
VSDFLDEHRAALAKIDEAVARAGSTAELACKAGCASCCVDGLSVLPVEAALIESTQFVAPKQREGMCAFLDDNDRCAIYAVRPVMCRTHGLPLKMEARSDRGSLKIVGQDVEVCSLNFTSRDPQPSEILDATKILMLLTTVDRRFRARAGIPDDDRRVSLKSLT